MWENTSLKSWNSLLPCSGLNERVIVMASTVLIAIPFQSNLLCFSTASERYFKRASTDSRASLRGLKFLIINNRKSLIESLTWSFSSSENDLKSSGVPTLSFACVRVSPSICQRSGLLTSSKYGLTTPSSQFIKCDFRVSKLGETTGRPSGKPEWKKERRDRNLSKDPLYPVTSNTMFESVRAITKKSTLSILRSSAVKRFWSSPDSGSTES